MIPAPQKTEDIPLKQRGLRLQKLHWLVLGLSIGLTMVAWRVSSEQNKALIEAEFRREADHVAELIQERMGKYEDGLWGGVAAIKALGRAPNRSEWIAFSKSLRIEEKYPGINGIGVILQVPLSQRKQFLAAQRRQQPEFKIHPLHSNPDLWPITFIEPLEANRKALGLDMAFEPNRYEAVVRAAETGNAQITAPIKLVQDSTQTPGFLFFAPFDKALLEGSESALFEKSGMVYAPFVVQRLMQGTLDKSRRHVGLSIQDGNETIYDEHKETEVDYDPSPLFRVDRQIDLYGRQWDLDIRTSLSFRDKVSFVQPRLILFGGIVIDGLVLLLFILISRSRDSALLLARKMTDEATAQRSVAENAAKLASLGEMAGGIAHEINNPITILQGYGRKLRRLARDKKVDESNLNQLADRIERVTDRIASIVNGLRNFSRDGSTDTFKKESVSAIVRDALDFCEQKFKHHGIDLRVSCDDQLKILCQKVQISQVLVNVLSNARHVLDGVSHPFVEIRAFADGSHAVIEIENSGPRIEESIERKIFYPFFTTKGVGEGTGLGLSISKGIVEKHGGRFYLKAKTTHTTFVIEIPAVKASLSSKRAA